MKKMAKAFLSIFGASCFLIAGAFWLASCSTETLPKIDDGSTWEKAIEPGFGNTNNYAIVAMAEYKGTLYAMTRNEIQGAEIWRSIDGKSWEQVLFPNGVKNGIYGNPWLSCLWGSMIVFKDKLYCGFSSGHQGTYLDSTGAEIWRYDGSTWEPVISDKKDKEESGTITAIAGCADKDDAITAQFTDSSKNWAVDQWKGGVLQITSGKGEFRRFQIVSNTANTLVIQQKEAAGTPDEYTVCGKQTLANSFPAYEYTIGEVMTGDAYEIGTGNDENGFGNFWNKMITEMVIFEDKLYVSTGLNYEYGAQVWYTEDGDAWTVTQPTNSFGNYHTDAKYPGGNKPISTSITSLCVSSASGEPVLYAGGTGSSGSEGGCSRVAKMTATGWELIVDRKVDANDTGTNESGFGGGMNCSMWNGDFMPWSLADFKNRLYVGIQSLAGARVLYTATGSSEDGNWAHSVGEDAQTPNGFDGKRNTGMPILYQNIAANLFPFNGNTLYAGLVSVYAPTLLATQETLTGAHIWKTSDGTAWAPVTRSGFGDKHITSFETFAVFKGDLYAGANKGSVDGPDGLNPPEGGMIYHQTSSAP